MKLHDLTQGECKELAEWFEHEMRGNNLPRIFRMVESQEAALRQEALTPGDTDYQKGKLSMVGWLTRTLTEIYENFIDDTGADTTETAHKVVESEDYNG